MQKIIKYKIMYIYLSIFQKKNSLMKQKTLSELKILFWSFLFITYIIWPISLCFKSIIPCPLFIISTIINVIFNYHYGKMHFLINSMT